MNAEIQKLITDLNKQFGEGTVFQLSDDNRIDVERLSTGLLSLDEVLGGGWPYGRMVEIYGPESSCKSLLSLMAIAQAQKEGKLCAYLDLEQTFDQGWAEKQGVDTENLFFSQPSTAEESWEIVQTLVESGQVGLIVIDSLSALPTKAEFDGDFGQANVGTNARLNSQAMRKLVKKVAANNVILIMISQIREKIGVMFGSPEISVGGRAVKFTVSIRVETRGSSAIKDGDEVTGKLVNVKCVKNKTAAPLKKTELTMLNDSGFSRMLDTINMAVSKKIIDKSGSWYYYGEDKKKLGQGTSNVEKFLLENPEVLSEIESKIKELI